MAKFAPGDRVRARAADPDGHTRLPRYARGHTGEVLEVRATWALPDETVRGQRRPEPVYAVRFGARELWGAGSHEVILELWESYLEDEQPGGTDG